MGGRNKKLLSTINTQRVGSTLHFGFSSRGENYFPFNPLNFLIHALQIRCSHTAESYVSGSVGGHILVYERNWKSPPLEREVWGQVELGRGWRRRLSKPSCFTISSWPIVLAGNPLTSFFFLFLLLYWTSSEEICKISKRTSCVCRRMFVSSSIIMHSIWSVRAHVRGGVCRRKR